MSPRRTTPKEITHESQKTQVVILGALAPVAQKIKEIMKITKKLVDADHYSEVEAHLSEALAEIALGYAEAEGINLEGMTVDVEKGLVVLTVKGG